MILKLKNLSLVLIAAFSMTVFSQPRIDLSEGSLFLLGSLSARYDMTGFKEPEHRFSLESDVGGGYFVIDRLGVGLSIPAEWQFTPSNGGKIGGKLFSTYFFDTNSVVFPYVGANLTPRYNMTKRSFELLAGIDGGVLVSMSESVALDFGLRPEVQFKLYDTQKWKFSLPAGYLGVRAIF